MEAANEAQLSETLPFRRGALGAEKIRAECPQFRILIIGKANAGKTTILRKMCNAKPDVKPIIYDAKGKKVKENVRLENLQPCWHELTSTGVLVTVVLTV